MSSWGSHSSPGTVTQPQHTNSPQQQTMNSCVQHCSYLLTLPERARTSLLYLVNQLANMEHSFHHILLLEIKSLTDTFSSILGSQSRDIYRMSNSFSAIAKLLVRQLDTDGAAAARYCWSDKASALSRAL